MDVRHEDFFAFGQSVVDEDVGAGFALGHAEVDADAVCGLVFGEGDDCVLGFLGLGG